MTMTTLTKSQIETLKSSAAADERYIDTLIEKRMREDNVPIGTAQALVVQTLKGAEAYLNLFKARVQIKGAEIDELTTSIAKSVEAFGIEHNLRTDAARARLEEVSPTFKAQTEALATAYHDRFVAIDNVQGLQSFQGAQKIAEVAKAQAAAEAPTSSKLPSLEKFERHVMGIALKRSVGKDKVDLGAATEWALNHDPTTQALKREYDRERIAAANGYLAPVTKTAPTPAMVYVDTDTSIPGR